MCPPSHGNIPPHSPFVTDWIVTRRIIAFSAWCWLNFHKFILESQAAFGNTTFERCRRQHSVFGSGAFRVELRCCNKILSKFRGRLSFMRKGFRRQTENESHAAVIVSEDMCCCRSVSQCARGLRNVQSGVRWSAEYDGGDGDTHGAADLFPSNTASRYPTAIPLSLWMQCGSRHGPCSLVPLRWCLRSCPSTRRVSTP